MTSQLWLTRDPGNSMEKLSAALVGRTAEHLNGIAWHERRVPVPWHRCKAVSRYRLGLIIPDQIDRCRCGAERAENVLTGTPGRWRRKNSRLLRRARYGSLA
jgi:hypothetical protein